MLLAKPGKREGEQAPVAWCSRTPPCHTEASPVWLLLGCLRTTGCSQHPWDDLEVEAGNPPGKVFDIPDVGLLQVLVRVSKEVRCCQAWPTPTCDF